MVDIIPIVYPVVYIIQNHLSPSKYYPIYHIEEYIHIIYYPDLSKIILCLPITEKVDKHGNRVDC